MRFVVAALAGACLWTCACGGPRVEGVVRSASGEALPGVSVSIARNAAVATTDNLGRYSLEATDGPVTLRFSRSGFTTESIRLTLTSGQGLSAPEIVLYPVPPQGPDGAIWVGTDGSKPLPRTTLECRKQGSASLLTDEWVVAEPASRVTLPAIPAGVATFVVRAASEPVLVRLDEASGATLVVSRSVSAWGIEKERQERTVPVSSVRTGEEGLLVVAADLTPGLYLLRDTVTTAPFPATPAAAGYLFRATTGKALKASL